MHHSLVNIKHQDTKIDQIQKIKLQIEKNILKLFAYQQILINHSSDTLCLIATAAVVFLVLNNTI